MVAHHSKVREELRLAWMPSRPSEGWAGVATDMPGEPKTVSLFPKVPSRGLHGADLHLIDGRSLPSDGSSLVAGESSLLGWTFVAQYRTLVDRHLRECPAVSAVLVQRL